MAKKKIDTTENTIQDSEIKKALIGSKKPIQRLGQGVHNNIFYYGTNLLYDNKPISALVTSDKKLYLGLNYVRWKCVSCEHTNQTIKPAYEKIIPPKNCSCSRRNQQDWKIEEIVNPIKNQFGLNYRTEFNEEAIDYVWQTEVIKKFLAGKYLKKELKEIYQQILEINQKYVDHLNPISHKYLACWTMATYCYTLFEQFGRSYQRAEKGSGKTKQSRIIKFLAFNPMWITKGTESSIFRDAEATCGTFIVDNMDKLHEELKRSMEHLIETGWMHDATYRLTNIDTKKTEKFMSYTPMNINNIFGLDENTIDKTFEISMLRSVNQNIQRTKPTAKNENWDYIRNSLREWMLDNWKEVLKTYEKLSASFSGREFDVVEGTLTIAKLIGKKEYEEIENYVKEKIEEQNEELETNPAYMIFSRIWKKFEGETVELNIFLKELSEELFPLFNPNLEEGSKEYINRKRNFSKYIGKIIRSVPMFRKGGLSKGKTYITIKKKDLKQYLTLQRFIDKEGILKTDKDELKETEEKKKREAEAKRKAEEKDKKHLKEPVPLPTSPSSSSSTCPSSSTPIFNDKDNNNQKNGVEQGEQGEQGEDVCGNEKKISEQEADKIMENFEVEIPEKLPTSHELLEKKKQKELEGM